MNELHLFAGAGGGILGGLLLGHRCIGAVEIDPYCRQVLVARQRDGILPYFPIFPDVCTFDGTPWRGRVDIVAGGFPCQDISVAGKGKGISGARSGLWGEMARIVGEIRPRYVFVENSPALVTRGLGVVLGDLAALGFDAAWRVLSAADLGAPHLRERIWILAHADSQRCGEARGLRSDALMGAGRSGEAVAHADAGQRDGANRTLCAGRNAADCRGPDDAHAKGQRRGEGRAEQHPWDRLPEPAGVRREVPDPLCDGAQGLEPRPQPCRLGRSAGLHDRARGEPVWREWPSESGVRRVVDGMAHRAHRIRAGGNGQVPRVAAAAFALLAEEFA